MYSFNVVLGLLDELLELKEYVKHESEASQARRKERHILQIQLVVWETQSSDRLV